MSLPNPFNTLQSFSANGTAHQFYSLPALEAAGFKVSRLPVSIRLVLESLLRNADGKRVTEQAIRDLAGWGAKAPRTEEIPFVVAGSCCRTSPACRCWWTSRRCARPW